MEIEDINKAVECYSKNSFIEKILNDLKVSERMNNVPIWHYFLLLKWVLIFGRNSRIALIPSTFNNIIRGIEHLEIVRGIFKNFPMNQAMSILAYQQFYLQSRKWKDSFGRNIQLFYLLDKSGYHQKKFFETMQIEIVDFVKLLFLLWAYSNDQLSGYKYNGIINDDFNKLGSILTNGKAVNNFINKLQLNQFDAKEKLQPHDVLDCKQEQVYEQTPFTRYPLFRYNKTLYLLHKDLLSSTLNHYIYDTLKFYDNDFTTKFGKGVFEDYVELGLKELNIKYLTDIDLRHQYLHENNLPKTAPKIKDVDFVVDDSILIECKAIEIRPKVGVNPTRNALNQQFKDNVVYAYTEQMFTVANNLRRKTDKEFWGLIVTYKEIYYGNGLDAYDELFKEPLVNFCKERNIDITLIPPENLYFIDILTWDKLIQTLKVNKLTLRKVLETAKGLDRSEKTKKLFFSAHLDSYNIHRIELSYIDSAFELGFGEILSRRNHHV